MTELDLRDKGLGDGDCAWLAAVVAKCRALQTVYLSGNKFGPAGWRALMVDGVAEVVLQGSMPALLARFGIKLGDTEWDLGAKGLTDTDCVWIAAAISKSTSLQKVELRYNQIWDAGAAALAAAISKSTSLQEVGLGENGLEDAGATALAAAISTSTSLQEVDLNHNWIGDAGATALSAAISKSTSLQSVDLSGNPRIGTAGWTALMVDGVTEVVIRRSRCWERRGATAFDGSRWDLNQKGLTDADCVWIAAVISKSARLRQVRLINNSIGDAGAIAVAAAISKSTSLQTVYLTGNKIGDAGAIAVAAAISKSTSLQTVYLTGNKIGDAGATVLAAAISKCTSLQTVEVEENPIGAPEKAALANVKRSGLDLRYGDDPPSTVVSTQAREGLKIKIIELAPRRY